MNGLSGNMPPARRRGKYVPHGQIAWSHAGVGVLLAVRPRGTELTIGAPACLILICSPRSWPATSGV